MKIQPAFKKYKRIIKLKTLKFAYSIYFKFTFSKTMEETESKLNIREHLSDFQLPQRKGSAHDNRLMFLSEQVMEKEQMENQPSDDEVSDRQESERKKKEEMTAK